MTRQDDALAGLLAERNTWARQLADLRDERDTARAERDQALAAKAEAEHERDILVTRIAGDRADLILESVGGAA